MRRLGLRIYLLFALITPLVADANLQIKDVGLHGYTGTPSVVEIALHNPSPRSQAIHLQIAAGNKENVLSTVTSDLTLNGGEQRELEVPVLIPYETTKLKVEASIGGSVFAVDSREQLGLRSSSLVVLVCTNQEVCKNVQSQIQFSGTIEERAQKNRELAFEVMDEPRENWWAYSAARTVVLATPIASFTSQQRDALEGFLRTGGRLVLIQDQIADTSFLSAYQKSLSTLTGERVGRGTLFRVTGLSSDALGAIFTGSNLDDARRGNRGTWYLDETSFLLRRYAASFDFPRLGWVLFWLAMYIVVLGPLNFWILRRLRRLEYGWLTMCGLALLFAAGFYFSSARKRPKEFRLDNLGTYFLDDGSALAATKYSLRVSAPTRRDIMISVADPAVFVYSNSSSSPTNSQIWSEMNREAPPRSERYDVQLGPPRQLGLSLLKWSFRDMNLEGLHQFPGTVRFVAPGRLRNDTGQHFSEAAYLDYRTNLFYELPALAPGQEVDLGAIKPSSVTRPNGPAFSSVLPEKSSLQELANAGWLATGNPIFVGFSDGPALPVTLDIPHQRQVHSLIVVNMEQP
jgi:hypothetical protein